MTQTETITWHKYPDEEPPKFDEYLVQNKWGHIKMDLFTTDNWYMNEDEYIIAWAELPKGLK